MANDKKQKPYRLEKVRVWEQNPHTHPAHHAYNIEWRMIRRKTGETVGYLVGKKKSHRKLQGYYGGSLYNYLMRWTAYDKDHNYVREAGGVTCHERGQIARDLWVWFKRNQRAPAQLEEAK